MKLKKPLKGVAEIRANGPFDLPSDMRAQLLPHQREAWDFLAKRHNAEQERRAAAVTPEDHKAAGMSFNGTMPDKGEKDGSCNRSACQMPLKGKPQFWMDSHRGRLYYCADCERQFSDWDRQIREPLRCTPDEDNVNLF